MQLLKIVFSTAMEESRPSDQGELAVDRGHTVQRQRHCGETGAKLESSGTEKKRKTCSCRKQGIRDKLGRSNRSPMIYALLSSDRNIG